MANELLHRKSDLYLSSLLLAIFITVISGITGGTIIFFLYGPVLPPWHKTEMNSIYQEASNFLFIDFYSTTDDPTNDTLYVKTRSREVYAIFQDEWKLLKPLPNGDTIAKIKLRDYYSDAPIWALSNQGHIFQLNDDQWDLQQRYNESQWDDQTQCASEWQHTPPIRKRVIDSTGVLFERPLSQMARCYILLEDGSLQVWTRDSNVFSLLYTVLTGIVLGMVLGSIMGGVIAYSKIKNWNHKQVLDV